MEKNTIILLICIALVGLFLGEINEATSNVMRDITGANLYAEKVTDPSIIASIEPLWSVEFELQDGTIVSDIEAIQSIKKHPTKKTIYGAPMLDYTTFPKVSYKKAKDHKGKEYDRDVNNEPKEKTPKPRRLQKRSKKRNRKNRRNV